MSPVEAGWRWNAGARGYRTHADLELILDAAGAEAPGLLGHGLPRGRRSEGQAHRGAGRRAGRSPGQGGLPRQAQTRPHAPSVTTTIEGRQVTPIASVTLSEGHGPGERSPSRRYLQPDFRCLCCKRRSSWASARTRYLQCCLRCSRRNHRRSLLARSSLRTSSVARIPSSLISSRRRLVPPGRGRSGRARPAERSG
jgi:hypothetical protein